MGHKEAAPNAYNCGLAMRRPEGWDQERLNTYLAGYFEGYVTAATDLMIRESLVALPDRTFMCTVFEAVAECLAKHWARLQHYEAIRVLRVLLSNKWPGKKRQRKRLFTISPDWEIESELRYQKSRVYFAD